MSRKDDLEKSIHQCYQLVREFEIIRQDTENPKEKRRAERAIAEQWEFIKGYLPEYDRLCQHLGLEVPQDIAEIAIAIRYPLPSVTLPTPAEPRPSLSNRPALELLESAHALIIGIAAYRYIRPLRKTTTDAQDLYDTLLQQGYSPTNVVLLLDEQATKPAISDRLNWLAHRVGPDDTAIIFFSGHGVQLVGGFWPGEYLCPIEAALDRVRDTLISNEELTTGLRAIQTGRLVVFLDACHAGGVGDPKDPAVRVKAGLSEATYAQLAAGEGRIIIASCRPDEVSWELPGMRNGLFTNYLLEGLRGGAARQDRTVWMSNLFGYVYERVSQHDLQHPFQKSAAEDFVIAISAKEKVMSGQVSLQCTWGKAILPASDTKQLTYLLVEVKPPTHIVTVRIPLNLVLILDRSGSMCGEWFDYAREAMQSIVEDLEPEDRLAFVTFDHEGQVVIPSQLVGDKEELAKLIKDIQCFESQTLARFNLEAEARADQTRETRISSGFVLGLREVQKALDPSRLTRIILLTGSQTYGDEAQCKQLAQDAGRLGVPITALGLGNDWNEELLDAIAEASGGICDFIDAPHKIRQHLQYVLHSMQAIVVNNAQLILRLVEGVRPTRVWQVMPLISQLSPTALSDHDVQVYLDELEKEPGEALLVELLLPPRPAGHYRIAQAEVSYDVPAAGIVGEKVRSDILLTFTDDAALAQQHDARVMNLVEKVAAFKLQTRALD